MQLLFASHNENKIIEVKELLQHLPYKIVSLKDIGFNEDIPETAATIEGNAILKATYLNEKTNLPVFADDTGLEIDALGGRPGVYSARFAGEKATYQENIDKVLFEMKNQKNRSARFKTIIALYKNQVIHTFEGCIEGRILEKENGENGFGYDPIFQPEGYNQSFAEMSSGLKNSISHRGLAMKKLLKFLEKEV